MIQTLHPHVICANKSPSLSATGLPPHVICLQRFESLENAVKELGERLPEVILKGVDDLMEEKGMKAGNVTLETLREVFTQFIQESGIEGLLQSERRERRVELEETEGNGEIKTFYWGG